MTGLDLITEERFKQVVKHGYHIDHDAQYTDRELLSAAIYAITGDRQYYPPNWNIDTMLKIKAKSEIEQLKVAGALIAAEIDRLLKLEEDEKAKIQDN